MGLDILNVIEDAVADRRAGGWRPLRLIPLAGSLHVLSLGCVWNELARNAIAKNRILRLSREQAASATLLLVLEPASQTYSRAAMELREELVGFGYLPLYPCPNAAPCPMLPLSRDWCCYPEHPGWRGGNALQDPPVEPIWVCSESTVPDHISVEASKMLTKFGDVPLSPAPSSAKKRALSPTLNAAKPFDGSLAPCERQPCW